MKNKGDYIEIDDVLDLGEAKSIGKIYAEEIDKLIAKDIAAVFKKYFPYAKIDEKKVLKLAKMLIAEESKKGGAE
jgi:hypothetical protein